MLLLAYHCGALGHSTLALMECCTKEGGGDFPTFVKGSNLHYYEPLHTVAAIRHPECNVKIENDLGHRVASSTSFSMFGRFLIILMGLNKWNHQEPDFNLVSEYKQHGQSYGEQLEILAVTLLDKVKSDSDWFVDANYTLDITNYWGSPANVSEFLSSCGLTPLNDKVTDFCKLVANANQCYYDSIKKCQDIVHDVLNKNQRCIDVSFLEAAVCLAMLIDYHKVDHASVKLLQCQPTSVSEFVDIFD